MENWKKTFWAALPLAMVLFAFYGPGGPVKNQDKLTGFQVKQPLLGSRSAKILQSAGLKFKDLNKNGRLDKYEDWRLSAEARSKDLLAKMSVEEKVGFMLISATRLKNDWAFEAPKNKEPITSDFNDEDLVAAAEKIVGNARFVERANLALRKSIVLLRNEAKALPLQARTRVYFETYQKQYGAPASGAGTVYTGEGQQYPVEFVHTPAEADVILLWIIPGARPLFASDGSPLLLSLSKCAVDVAYINKLTAQKPTILALNYTNPWVIDEIYNKDLQGHFKGVLATFGTTPEALLDVVTGKFKPGGRMPFTTPVSEAAAQNQKEDVPGYLEGPGYALFRYDEGLSYR